MQWSADHWRFALTIHVQPKETHTHRSRKSYKFHPKGNFGVRNVTSAHCSTVMSNCKCDALFAE